MGSVWEDIENTAKQGQSYLSDPLNVAGIRPGGLGSIGSGAGGFGGAAPGIDLATHEDPNIVALRKKLAGESQMFRENLPQMKNDQYESAANAGHAALDDTTRTIRASANQRGLLYSGLRQGQEAGARQRMASTLASQRAEINREAESLANSKDEVVGNVGLAGYDAAQKRAEDAYNLNLQNEINRRRGMAQIGEGVGYGLGTYYQNKNKPTPTKV